MVFSKKTPIICEYLHCGQVIKILYLNENLKEGRICLISFNTVIYV